MEETEQIYLEKFSNELKSLPSLVNRDRKAEAKKLKKDERKECIAALKAKPAEFKCCHCEVDFDKWQT